MIRRLFTIAFLSIALVGQALAQLSGPQLAQLKAAINNTPEWSALPNNDDGAFALAAILNQTAAPDFIVIKSSLSRHDILTGTSLESTVFTWTGGAYITRSQGERDAFREIFNSTGTVDPRPPSITAAFLDIFSGAGGATNRAHITAMSKRKARAGEKIFATGAGTLANPATLTFEGALSPTDVSTARNLP